MSQLLDRLRDDLQNEDARYAYVNAHLNSSVAAQIKHFRGGASQQEIAEKIGTKQSGISRLENANYSSWKVETLRKLARAFGLRLKISFEEFGTLIPEIENFKKGTLHRRKFEDDPAFKDHVDESKGAAANAQTDLRQQVTESHWSGDWPVASPDLYSGPAIPQLSNTAREDFGEVGRNNIIDIRQVGEGARIHG